MISVQFLEDVGLMFTGYYHTNPPHKAISLHTQLMLSLWYGFSDSSMWSGQLCLV